MTAQISPEEAVDREQQSEPYESQAQTRRALLDEREWFIQREQLLVALKVSKQLRKRTRGQGRFIVPCLVDTHLCHHCRFSAASALGVLVCGNLVRCGPHGDTHECRSSHSGPLVVLFSLWAIFRIPKYTMAGGYVAKVTPRYSIRAPLSGSADILLI